MSILAVGVQAAGEGSWLLICVWRWGLGCDVLRLESPIWRHGFVLKRRDKFTFKQTGNAAGKEKVIHRPDTRIRMLEWRYSFAHSALNWGRWPALIAGHSTSVGIGGRGPQGWAESVVKENTFLVKEWTPLLQSSSPWSSCYPDWNVPATRREQHRF